MEVAKGVRILAELMKDIDPYDEDIGKRER
jgi:hypothetical protein